MEGKEEAGCPVQVKAIVPLPDDAGRSGSRLFIPLSHWLLLDALMFSLRVLRSIIRHHLLSQINLLLFSVIAQVGLPIVVLPLSGAFRCNVLCYYGKH